MNKIWKEAEPLYRGTRDAIIFHASEWGEEIVAEGRINGGPVNVRDDLVYNRHHHGITAISCTRDSRFARLYAPCVFALDWKKIRCRYQSIQRAEGAYGEHDYRLEAEELILTPGLSLSTYCTGIWLDHHMDAAVNRDMVRHPLFRGFFYGHHG